MYKELLEQTELMALRRADQPGMRAAPVTPRGIDSREAILRAAGQLLAELPAYKLTTHTIAAQANVNIATLYRYFDDVSAILRELALRREVRQCERLAELLPVFVAMPDWRIFVDRFLREMALTREPASGGAGLGASLLGIPELAPIVEAGMEANVLLGATALADRDPSRSTEEWLPIMRVALGVARRMLDERHSRPQLDERHLDLVVLMVISFLENFLPD